MSEVCAVVVARGGSRRIPKKSLLSLQGATLIERKIGQLKECQLVDRVIFGSDDEEMLKCAKLSGAEVYQRPSFYCDESQASANDMIGNMLSFFQTDFVMWAHCTNPLISAKTYDSAIALFKQTYHQKKCDSLLSVVEIREHLWHKSMWGGGVYYKIFRKFLRLTIIPILRDILQLPNWNLILCKMVESSFSLISKCEKIAIFLVKNPCFLKSPKRNFWISILQEIIFWPWLCCRSKERLDIRVKGGRDWL